MPKLNDLTGKSFGRLTAVAYMGRSRWRCVCECGAMHEADAYHLRSAQIRSCGCLQREIAPLNSPPHPVEPRFWPKVEKTDGCWIWRGARISKNRGQFTVNGEKRMASRVSWELHYGPIPDGMLVCHHCDNGLCVRPSHLFLGTYRDNTQDAIRKGRMSIGVLNPRATINDDKARRILAAYASSPMSPCGRRRRNGVINEIAARFDVTRDVVMDLVYGRTWTHLRAEQYEGSAA